MLFLKYAMLIIGAGLIAGAVTFTAVDLYRLAQIWRKHEEEPEEPEPPAAVRWQGSAKIAGVGVGVILLALSFVVVPSGENGVRVSEFSGTVPGTLQPGVHFVMPLVESVATYPAGDRIFITAADAPKTDKEGKAATTEGSELLQVQTKEGLLIGLSVAVRYRIDAKQLAYIHENLPEPIDETIVSPSVLSVFRQVAPNFLTREFLATRRAEMQQQAVETITKKLASDGILVKEVMLRDITLPPEYAKGLEGLLLKEQENERLVVETEIKRKMVQTAELEAEAEKARRIKQAEGEAAVVVLRAKGEADAMQHTLPLKEKQIQQTRLEAEARKESTLKNAEAAAQAKVIDSKAELEKRNLMAQAEANHTRLMAQADSERLTLEAKVLKENPLLIQKIIAERLSDKVQIMMVPNDGKFFFANDVLRSPMMMSGETGAAQH